MSHTFLRTPYTCRIRVCRHSIYVSSATLTTAQLAETRGKTERLHVGHRTYMSLTPYRIAIRRNSRQNSQNRRGNRKAAPLTPYVCVWHLKYVSSDTLYMFCLTPYICDFTATDCNTHCNKHCNTHCKGRASDTLCVCLAPYICVIWHLIDVLSDMSICKQLPLLLLLFGRVFSLFANRGNSRQNSKSRRGNRKAANRAILTPSVCVVSHPLQVRKQRKLAAKQQKQDRQQKGRKPCEFCSKPECEVLIRYV